MTCKRKILLILAAMFAPVSLTASDQSVGVIEIYSDGETAIESQPDANIQGSISDLDKTEWDIRFNTDVLDSSGKFNLDLANQESLVRRPFAQMDQNSDGYLTLTELTASNGVFALEFIATNALFAVLAASRTAADSSPSELAEWKRAETALLQMLNDEMNRTYLSPDSEFTVADADGDGQMSLDEYERRHDRVSDFVAQQHFSTIDLNGDGYVEFSEFVAPLEKFHALDKDQDGFVNLQELVQDSIENEAEW